jgi:release factor glutamine methyltransferase
MRSGTGLLGLIAAKTAKDVLAVDINDSAVRCTKENAQLNGFKNFKVIKSDLFSRVSGRFSLIIFNPPYLPTEGLEPKDEVSLAWDGGRSGRRVIDRFLAEVKEHIVPRGRLLMIGSSLSNYERTMEVLDMQGFKVSIKAMKKLDFESLVLIHAIYDF